MIPIPSGSTVRTDDSGMAPSSLGTPQSGGLAALAQQTPNAFGQQHPLMLKLSNMAAPPTGFFGGKWLWNMAQQMKSQGKFGEATPAPMPTPQTPQAPAPADPGVQAPSGARLGQLFSGYGY